jgi:hypothetical protein
MSDCGAFCQSVWRPWFVLCCRWASPLSRGVVSGRGSDKAARTTVIEVGMQNSALAATLVMFFRRWKNGGQA